MQCTEKSVFNVAVSEALPYVDIGKPDDVTGSFLHLVRRLIRYCCPTHASYNISRIADNQHDLIAGMSDDEQIILPYSQVHGFQYDTDDLSFLPVLPSPGSILLVDFDRESFDLFTIVIMTWQLFLLMFVSCALAGIVVWFVDQWTNPEEFPPTFFKGFWEGYWWAFVSMTTVGYGDSKPKSIIGRIFAMLWIIIGISLFAVFTATLTTALNSESKTRSSLQGRKVAVLNGSEEHHLAILMGAIPFAYNTLSEMSYKVEEESVEDILSGILLDYIYVPALPQLFLNDPLKITKEITMPRVHGILFQNLHNDLVKCFHKHAKKERYLVQDTTSSYTENRKIMHVDGSETISNWLGINGVHLGIYAGCVVTLFVSFVIWELAYNRNRQKVKINIKTQTSPMTSDVAQSRNIPYKNNLQSACDRTDT